MSGSGPLRQLCGVAHAQTSAHGHGDASSGAGNQASKCGRTCQRISSAPGGEHAMTPGVDNIFQCPVQIRSLVKGAMKRDFHRICQLHQRSDALFVHRTVRLQHAGYDAAGARGARMLNFGAHQGEIEFVAVVGERTGTDEDVDGNLVFADRLFDEPSWRCQTIYVQPRTDLDAVRAPIPRRLTRIQRFAAQFEDRPSRPGRFATRPIATAGLTVRPHLVAVLSTRRSLLYYASPFGD